MYSIIGSSVNPFIVMVRSNILLLQVVGSYLALLDGVEESVVLTLLLLHGRLYMIQRISPTYVMHGLVFFNNEARVRLDCRNKTLGHSIAFFGGLRFKLLNMVQHSQFIKKRIIRIHELLSSSQGRKK